MLASQNCSQLQRQLDLMEIDLNVNREEGDAVIRMNEQIIGNLKTENTTLRHQATTLARTFSVATNPERVQREIYSLAREVDNLGHRRKRLEKQLALLREKEPTFTDAFLDSITPSGRSLKKETEYVSCVKKGCIRRNPNVVDLTSSDVFRNLEKRHDEIELKYRDAKALNSLFLKLRRELQEQSALYDKQIHQCKTTLASNSEACQKMGIIAEEAILASLDMDRSLQTEQINAAMKKSDNQERLDYRREQVRVAMASAMPRSPTTARPPTGPADDTTIVTVEDETIGAFCKRMFQTRVAAETGVTKIDHFVKTAVQQQAEGNRLEALSVTLREKNDTTKKSINAILQGITDTEYALDTYSSVLNGNASKLKDAINVEKEEFLRTKEKMRAVEDLINSINQGLQTLLDKLLLIKAPPISELQSRKGFEDLYGDMPDNIKDIIVYYGSEASNSDVAMSPENEFQRIVSMALVVISKLITLKECRICAGSHSCSESVNNSSILDTQGLPVLPVDTTAPEHEQGSSTTGAGLYEAEGIAGSAEEYFNQILGKGDGPGGQPAQEGQEADATSDAEMAAATAPVTGTQTRKTLLSITKEDIIGQVTGKTITMDTLGDDVMFNSDDDEYEVVGQEDYVGDNVKIDLPWSRPASKAPLPSRTSGKASARTDRMRRIPQVLKERDPMDRDVIKKASETVVRMNAETEKEEGEQ